MMHFDKSPSVESLTSKLVVSDELSLLIENNTNVKDLDAKQIDQLLSLMNSWMKSLQKEINFIEDIMGGKIQYASAINEYNFWDKRYNNFKAILEQLLTDKVVIKCINILEQIVNSQIVLYTLRIFNELKNDFQIMYDTTVRNTMYFMELIYDGIDSIINAPFVFIVENFLPLYNHLNLMWLTSSLFSRKKHMERLLESISNSVADRVSVTLSIPEIFQYKTSKAVDLVKSGLYILDRWEATYIKCKKDIEVISTIYFRRWAWEFDEDILFHRLHFVRLIVRDLDKIMKIIELILMRPEVSHIFKNSSESQIFIKNYITRIFFDLEINVYDSNREEIWIKIMDQFLHHFETNVYNKISQSMKISNSAINDVKLLQFFENMMIRHTLIKKLRPKYVIILEKFVVEINHYNTQFMSLKESPRLVFGVPPVAGKIILVQDLFLRAKRTARIVESTAKFPQIQKTKTLSIYGKFCQNILKYESNVVDKWLDNALKIEGRLMECALWTLRGNKLMSTFDKELFCFIDTALHLHLLGHDLPIIIMNLIEKQQRIILNIKMLDSLLEVYNEIVGRMDAPIALAMERHFSKVKLVMRPGFEKRYTYLSFQLPKFMKHCLRSLNIFNTIYKEIELFQTIISEKLELIENLKFFVMDPNYVQDIFVLFEQFITQGDKNMSIITCSMNYISKALNLIEKTCYDLEIDGHEHMRLLYEKYEKALYDAFIAMVRNNCKAYKNILDSDRVAFVIYGQLIDDKFTFIPNINTIYATLTKAMDDMFNRLKSVPRWLRTTNVLCPFINSMGTDESHLPYTYYTHVEKCEDVYDMKKECYNTIEILINRLKIAVQKFAGFGFMSEKRIKLIIDQFTETNPTLADYGEKLKYFFTLSTRVERELYIDYGCIRIDISEYIVVLRERCDFWHSVYANQLILESDDIMAKFSQNMVVLKKQLNNHFRNCQGLDIVEKAVKKIRQTVFRADSTFHEIHNRFHFMKRHKITVPNYQLNNFKDVQNNWQILYKDALSRNLCFENAKEGLVTINSI
ncbi:uncharacterized protein LOC112599500 [Melanaphis sacchari]|uniref:uncharacterized protein LOC112599500 n=1 Tax=Melanaphis sacchari TaxID=742174 RepID=UPI000DC14C16|nr:uncharacterized protein LOC112599500 [Melanaphis sacchari]